MLCVVKDITSVSIGCLEYKAEDGFIEVPDEAYKKLVSHPDIRPATSLEIAEREKSAAERKAAAEKAEAQRKDEEAAAAQKAAEQQAMQEAQAQPAAAEAAATPPEEAKGKGGGKSGGK